MIGAFLEVLRSNRFCTLNGELDAKGLKFSAMSEDLVDFGGPELGHHSPSIRATCHESRLLKLTEGITTWGEANAKLLGQFAFGQPVPGLEGSRRHRIPDHVTHPPACIFLGLLLLAITLKTLRPSVAGSTIESRFETYDGL